MVLSRTFPSAPLWLEKRLPDFALLLFVVAVTAGAFSGGMWASLGIGGAIILGVMVWWIEKKFPAPDADLTRLALIALLIMAGLNMNASAPAVSWYMWIRLVTIYLPLLLLTSPAAAARIGQPKFFSVVAIAMMAGGVALGLELHLKGPMQTAADVPLRLTHYNRSFSYLVLLLFPVLAGLWFSRQKLLILPLLPLFLVLAQLTESRASKLAIMVAVVVTAVAYFCPILVRKALMAVTVVGVSWPFAAQIFFTHFHDKLTRLPDSWRARVEIWDYISYRIMERPILGWGLGASHTLSPQEPHGALYVFTTIPAAHPHNVFAELWVELGLPGLALGLAFAFLTLRRIARLDPRLAPFALGAWSAALCLSAIAYDFWTDSLFAAFALTALVFGLLDARLKAESAK